MTFLMPNRQLLLLSVLMFSFCGWTQETEFPDLNYFKLLHQVKSVENQSFFWKDSEKNKEERTELHFNAEGLLTNRKVFDEDNQLGEEQEFTYDQSGNLIEELYTDNKVNKATYKTSSTYDDENIKLTQANFNPDGSRAQSKTWEYDDHGNLVALKETLHNSESARSIVFKYDSEGNKQEEIEYAEDWPDRKYTYQANQGKVVNKKEYRNIDEKEEWVLDYETRFIYNSSGAEIERKEIGYDQDNGEIIDERTIKTTYDEQGNPVKIQEEYQRKDIDGRNRSEVTTFDKNGNQLTYTADVSGREKQEETAEYEFDEHGNWISKLLKRNGEPFSAEERTIEYYTK